VTAVGSFLSARRGGGEWLLRLEDLDAPRVVPAAADDILSTLEILGLYWDRQVVRQSERIDAYQEALVRLQEAGWAYPCGCSRSEIVRASSASAGGGPGGAYPGTCRCGLPPGKSPRAYRVRSPLEPIRFRDRVQGEVLQDVERHWGDFVVRRADGPFAYHLAVVVDDAAAAITEVVRGADLLDATPCHIHLQSLLGLETPAYAHLPLVTDPGGKKLSKKESAVSLAAGRDLGRDGGRLLWGALLFLGQGPPLELRSSPATEVLAWGVSCFDMSRVPMSCGPFPVEVL
jgi:glutamyl-Q tRNA(Asp) synthetase